MSSAWMGWLGGSVARLLRLKYHPYVTLPFLAYIVACSKSKQSSQLNAKGQGWAFRVWPCPGTQQQVLRTFKLLFAVLQETGPEIALGHVLLTFANYKPIKRNLYGSHLNDKEDMLQCDGLEIAISLFPLTPVRPFRVLWIDRCAI